jgi:hypothetical protein
VRYLNNLVEQDHRSVKRVTRPMIGFKVFEAVQRRLAGIELMQMIRKRQLADGVEQGFPAAQQFLLTGCLIIHPTGSPAPPLKICDQSPRSWRTRG